MDSDSLGGLFNVFPTSKLTAQKRRSQEQASGHRYSGSSPRGRGIVRCTLPRPQTLYLKRKHRNTFTPRSTTSNFRAGEWPRLRCTCASSHAWTVLTDMFKGWSCTFLTLKTHSWGSFMSLQVPFIKDSQIIRRIQSNDVQDVSSVLSIWWCSLYL